MGSLPAEFVTQDGCGPKVPPLELKQNSGGIVFRTRTTNSSTPVYMSPMSNVVIPNEAYLKGTW